MEEYRHNIAVNLTQLRKKKGLTQQDVAKQLYYMDKAISKWENEYTTPSLDALIQLAKFYNVSIDYLIADHSGNPILPEEENVYHGLSSYNKFIISLMSGIGVWLLACSVYAILNIFISSNVWMIFVWAVPATFIVAIVFNEIWGRRSARVYFVSFLTWTILGAIFLQCIIYKFNVWMIFLVGIPLEIGFILWDRMHVK